MKKFVKENEKALKKFGMLRRYDDSKRYLQDNQHLVCEDTANYLVIWCINLEMEEVCLIFCSLPLLSLLTGSKKPN
jgi:cell division cycle protein 37